MQVNRRGWVILSVSVATLLPTLWFFAAAGHQRNRANLAFEKVRAGWSETDVIRECGTPDEQIESNARVMVYLDYPKWFCDLVPRMRSGTTIVFVGEEAGPITRWNPKHVRFQS